jgi:hypothetical protein
MIPNFIWTDQLVSTLGRVEDTEDRAEKLKNNVTEIVCEIQKDSYNSALLEVERTIVCKLK